MGSLAVGIKLALRFAASELTGRVFREGGVKEDGSLKLGCREARRLGIGVSADIDDLLATCFGRIEGDD